MNSEAADMEANMGRTIEWDSTEGVEKATDETLEIMDEEYPTERVGTSPVEGTARNTIAPESREVVIITDEEEKTEKVDSRDEAARARAATVHIYQQRLASEKTAWKRSEEERPRDTPRQRT